MTDIAAQIDAEDAEREPVRVSREVLEFRTRAIGRDEVATVHRHLVEYRTMEEGTTRYAKKERKLAADVQVFVDGNYAGDISQDETESEYYSTSPIRTVSGHPIKWVANHRSPWTNERILAAHEARHGSRPEKVFRILSLGYSEDVSRREAVANLLNYAWGAKLITKAQLAAEAAAEAPGAA